MPVELTDQQFAALTNAAKFLEEAASKPETRREFEKMAKKLRPEITTTDDLAEQYAAPIAEKLEATNKRLDDWLASQETEKTEAAQRVADEARDAAFGRLRADGFTDEGLEKIKGIMIDRSIPDPEAAAALYEKQNPKPVEGTSSWEPANWDIKGRAVDVDIEGLFKDPDGWSDRLVYDVLRDERSKAG
jgi:hypothetical protein